MRQGQWVRRGRRGALLLTALLLLLTASPAQAEFPERGSAEVLRDGVEYFKVSLKGEGPAQATTLWLYLPPGKHAAKSLPCVFIAPAGSTLMVGMGLADSDRAEHLPYLKAGFAVIAYDLDGPNPTRTWASLFAAAPKFMAAHGGVDNARVAMDYALERMPEINPDRLYAAGHSSAATVALDVTAADSRIKACCAFAGPTNLRTWLKPATLVTMVKKVPGFEAFVDSASPSQHIDDLKTKPIMLFAAEDDDVVPPRSVKDFTAALQQAGATQTKLVIAPTGGHYKSMILEGIPNAIAFLKEVDARIKK